MCKKRQNYLHAAVGLLLALFSLHGCNESANTPLVINPATIDFGAVPVGQIAKCQTSVSNRSAAVVSIKEVRTTCNCAKADLSSTVLQPGDEATLKVEIHKTSADGLFNGYIFLTANDYVVEAPVQGRFDALEKKLFCDPESVFFPEIQSGEELQLALRIGRKGETDVGKTSIEASAPWIKTYSMVSASPKTHLYKVVICPPRGLRVFNEMLRITGDTEADELLAPICGTIAPEIVLRPSALLVEEGQKEYVINIQTSGNTFPRLLDYAFEGTAFAGSVCAREQDSLRLFIELHPSDHSLATGKLKLKFEGQDNLLELPLTAN